MSSFEEWNKVLDETEALGFGLSMNLKSDAKQMTDAQNLALVHKFQENWGKIYGNAGLSKDYNEGAIAADLAKICAEIKPETPEMAVDLLNTTKDLFAHNESEGMCAFELESFTNQVRYLGDLKVAEAFVDATAQSFAKMQNAWDKGLPALEKYKEIATNHPELSEKILDTMLNLKEKVADSEDYKKSINEVLKNISLNDKVKQDVRENASQNTFDVEQKQSEQKEKTESNEKTNDNKKDEKQTFWDKVKTKFNDVFKKNKQESKKESKSSGDKAKNSRMAELINSKRMSKAGNSNGKSEGDNQRKSPALQQLQDRQVQVHGDVYHALETYARIAAVEEMSGISGLSYNGMDKSKSLDVLRKANPEELKKAVGEFKASSEKNPVGNVDFSARVVSVAEKLPEQLATERKGRINVARSGGTISQDANGNVAMRITMARNLNANTDR